MMRIGRTAAGLAVTVMLVSFGAPVTAQSQAKTAQDAGFLDGFDRLDRKRWFVSDGWTNGPHQSCLWDKRRVEIDGGRLRLSLKAQKKKGHALTCAEIQTEARHRYGTVEARMKVPYAKGLNANLFTFIGEPQKKPHNEIDFEFLAPKGPSLQTNFHIEGDSENTETIAMPADGKFHTYSLIWEPDRLRWFIDGKQIREAAGGPLPEEPQKIFLSLWSTDNLTEWMGRFDPASAPQVLEVDWAAYTPLGARCRFAASVLCREGIGAAR